MKYFLVTCLRGHMGTNQSTEITFAIKADNLLTAMDTARKMPGVKHHKSVVSCREITTTEYIGRRKQSAYKI